MWNLWAFMENFALQVAFLLLPSLPFLLFMKMQALLWASQVALEAKNLPTNAGDIGDVGATGLIPGLRRSPGVGNGNFFQSILDWKIPWTEERGGLQSMGRKESDTAEHAHVQCVHYRNTFRNIIETVYRSGCCWLSTQVLWIPFYHPFLCTSICPDLFQFSF